MSKTITRLFDSHTQAIQAVNQLEAAGIDHDRISLVSNNADNWHEGHQHAGREGPLGDANGDGDNDVADGAGKGATTGGLLGGGAGLLAGLGMLAIPGLGPVVAAGWLASTAVGAAIGAAAGGATGGLLGALKEAGHSDEEANVYSEGVRRGGALVSVRTSDDDADAVQAILNEQHGVDAVVRGDVYRQSGWSRFDAEAPVLSADEVRRERESYADEQRSFSSQEPTERGLDTPSSDGARPMRDDVSRRDI